MHAPFFGYSLVQGPYFNLIFLFITRAMLKITSQNKTCKVGENACINQVVVNSCIRANFELC